MKTRIMILIAVLTTSLFSCASAEKVAKKHFEKSVSKHEPTTAKLAMLRWPTKDSVSIVEKLVPGKTDTIQGPILYVNCADTANKNKNVPVPCPPSYIRVDTAKITEHLRYEDQRKTLLFEHKKDSLMAVIAIKEKQITAIEKAYQSETIKQDKKIDALKDYRNMWRRIAIILIAYSAFRVVARFKFPFISKFLP